MDELEKTTSFDDVSKRNSESDTSTKKEILDIYNSMKDIYPEIESPVIREIRETKRNNAEFKEHLKKISEFVSSFENCSVSSEISGEWNVIKKEINNHLFSINLEFGGGCSKLNKFYYQESEHLNSIRNKVGVNAIEYQMICSLVAEAIILDIESCIILQEGALINIKYSEIKTMQWRKTLQDCIDTLEQVSKLNMEYQYKYEKFTPFYKSLSEKGEQYGLIKKSVTSSKSGCLSVIAFLATITLLCSFI